MCVCACPKHPTQTTGRRNNNSRNRVSTKSLSASHPCAGTSLRGASRPDRRRPGPRYEKKKKPNPAWKENPTQVPKPTFPQGIPKGPWGVRLCAAQAPAGVAGGRNVTLIRPGSKITKKGRTMHNAQAQGRQTDTKHCKREQARDSRYAISLAEFKNNAWEILLCWGPWYHEQ